MKYSLKLFLSILTMAWSVASCEKHENVTNPPWNNALGYFSGKTLFGTGDYPDGVVLLIAQEYTGQDGEPTPAYSGHLFAFAQLRSKDGSQFIDGGELKVNEEVVPYAGAGKHYGRSLEQSSNQESGADVRVSLSGNGHYPAVTQSYGLLPALRPYLDVSGEISRSEPIQVYWSPAAGHEEVELTVTLVIYSETRDGSSSTPFIYLTSEDDGFEEIKMATLQRLPAGDLLNVMVMRHGEQKDCVNVEERGTCFYSANLAYSPADLILTD